MSISVDIDTKIKEAEVYRQMGLPKESLELYERILTNIPSREKSIHSSIIKEIDLLKGEIKERYPEDDEPITLSKDDVTGIQKALAPIDENA